MQPFAKLRVYTYSVIPDLETPLICACPPGDCRALTTRVIDGIVQHLSEGVAGDSSRGTLPVQVQVQVVSYLTPDHVLGEAEQRKFALPRRLGIHGDGQRVARERAASYCCPHGSQVEQPMATGGLRRWDSPSVG